MTQKQYRLMLRKLFLALESSRISSSEFTAMVDELKEIRARFLSIDSRVRETVYSRTLKHGTDILVRTAR